MKTVVFRLFTACTLPHVANNPSVTPRCPGARGPDLRVRVLQVRRDGTSSVVLLGDRGGLQHDVSTRKVDGLVKALGRTAGSPSLRCRGSVRSSMSRSPSSATAAWPRSRSG